MRHVPRRNKHSLPERNIAHHCCCSAVLCKLTNAVIMSMPSSPTPQNTRNDQHLQSNGSTAPKQAQTLLTDLPIHLSLNTCFCTAGPCASAFHRRVGCHGQTIGPGSECWGRAIANCPMEPASYPAAQSHVSDCTTSPIECGGGLTGRTDV